MRMGAGNPPRFGTDGVRGVAGTELTADFVRLVGRAAARELGSATVLVGCDPRPSSPEFVAALSEGLSSQGVNVVSVGMLPTPALAWLAAQSGFAAAMITASHNPYTDNGVKLFAAGGLKLSDAVEAAVETRLAALGLTDPDLPAGASVSTDADAADRYVAYLVSSFPQSMLVGRRVVVDCANGAMSVVAPEVLRRLGADVHVLNAAPNGRNINDGCGATHPNVLLAAVRARAADVGLAFDGDGDRVIAATVSGVIDGDRLIAILAPALRARGELRGDAVAVTVMSNLGLRLAMTAAGIRIVETPVGDRHVLAALEREDLVLGGEQSGHIIVRNRATTGDGLLAGLLLLETSAGVDRSLDALASAAMTSYPQVLVNVRTPRQDPDVAALVADEIRATEQALGGHGRVLVRSSGTESVVRVMVEATTEAVARAHADRLAAVITERLA